MVIVSKSKKGEKNSKKENTELRVLTLKRDRLSPAIYTYTCPSCKAAKAVTKDDMKSRNGKDFITCSNPNCKEMFEVKYEEWHNGI